MHKMQQLKMLKVRNCHFYYNNKKKDNIFKCNCCAMFHCENLSFLVIATEPIFGYEFE